MVVLCLVVVVWELAQPPSAAAVINSATKLLNKSESPKQIFVKSQKSQIEQAGGIKLLKNAEKAGVKNSNSL